LTNPFWETPLLPYTSPTVPGPGTGPTRGQFGFYFFRGSCFGGLKAFATLMTEHALCASPQLLLLTLEGCRPIQTRQPAFFGRMAGSGLPQSVQQLDEGFPLEVVHYEVEALFHRSSWEA